MKFIKKRFVFIFAVLALMLAFVCSAFIMRGGESVVANAEGDTRFTFEKYSVKYDVRADRTMDVQLDVQVRYIGSASTGFIFDIPVNNGDRVGKINAYSISMTNGSLGDVEFSVKNDDRDFVSIYMDDYTIKTNQRRAYRITYEYAITKPVDKNVLYLNAIGFGSTARMNEVFVEINLPDGLQDVKCYIGSQGDEDSEYYDYTKSGNKIALATSLDRYNGVTFEFEFGDGVLSTKPDFTPYWIIIAACAVFAALFAVKFLLFNKDDLTPIPCFSVPKNPPEGFEGAPSAAYDDPTQEMDPLTMGKLIDNKVDNSDVTSLIYYWANKGYIKINMQKEDDVVLIRIHKTLPQSAPHYQHVMYQNLFKEEMVHISSLTNTFYTTVEKVTKEVNAENGKLYDGKSMAVAILFALVGAVTMCLTPIVMAFVNLRGLLLIASMFMVVPAFIIFALTQTIKYRTLKLKKPKLIALYCGVAALAVLFSLIGTLLIPSYVIEFVPALLLGIVGFAIIMMSVSLICRTEDYSAKLNRILGFKDFIETVEKDKLEAMLESNPEFYYNVLPYAIVLGVSDKWANKFENLTVKPPQWSTSTSGDILNIMIFHSLVRNVNLNMVKTFISRPSSGSSSGFHGHFGGFSGGGHGGGGFRGK